MAQYQKIIVAVWVHLTLGCDLYMGEYGLQPQIMQLNRLGFVGNDRIVAELPFAQLGLPQEE